MPLPPGAPAAVASLEAALLAGEPPAPRPRLSHREQLIAEHAAQLRSEYGMPRAEAEARAREAFREPRRGGPQTRWAPVPDRPVSRAWLHDQVLVAAESRTPTEVA